jgi:hypothetical protein
MPVPDRVNDPSYIVIEGEALALFRLKETILKVASEGRPRVIAAEELRADFDLAPLSAIEVIASD